jgi:hypothetical protein
MAHEIFVGREIPPHPFHFKEERKVTMNEQGSFMRSDRADQPFSVISERGRHSRVRKSRLIDPAALSAGGCPITFLANLSSPARHLLAA